MVWRGFSSDHHALDWILPLVLQPAGRICVIPLTELPTRSLTDLLQADSLAKHHIENCLQQFQMKGVPANLKFRQGDPVNQVVDELAQSNYDLLVIAAEGHGDFVASVVTAIEERGVHPDRPIFILKPPFIK
jgi:nucleotide-binding universal stress UspA family protein